MVLTWTESLATGFTDIDNQHKELFKKVNDLINAMKQGKGKDEVARVLKFLEDYTIFHFQNEENYMKKFNYPEYEDHKAQHTGLINDLQKKKKDMLAKGVSSLMAIELQQELGDWLTIHIAEIDKMLGEFLNQKINK